MGLLHMGWRIHVKRMEGYRFPWGNDWDAGRANTQEVWGPDAWGIGCTTPVDRYPHGRTPTGVHDMAGNVWEFVSDAFASEWTPSPRPFRGGGNVTIKGGSFRRTRVDQACYARDESEVDCRGQNNGFRCAFRLREEE